MWIFDVIGGFGPHIRSELWHVWLQSLIVCLPEGEGSFSHLFAVSIKSQDWARPWGLEGKRLPRFIIMLQWKSSFHFQFAVTRAPPLVHVVRMCWIWISWLLESRKYPQSLGYVQCVTFFASFVEYFISHLIFFNFSRCSGRVQIAALNTWCHNEITITSISI